MIKALTVFAAIVLITPPAEAHGFNCGRYMSHVFKIKTRALALSWAAFPHTFATPGVVVVQRRKGRALGGGPGGHVSRIVSLLAPCRAVVNDNAGTYERDICKNLVAYVSPN